jgi:replication fork protection complex subunit Tof1/Swi1
VGWFLEAERARRTKSSTKIDYGIVGDALTQHTFIVVMKLMRDSVETGPTANSDVAYASIVCFKQILLTVREMDKSSDDDDREIADNMKARLFYEESSLDVLAHLPRVASKRSLAFMKDCIELIHTALKMLESFSKQHTSLYIRSKRKQTKKKLKNDDEDAPSENETEESQRVTRERKFEFTKFEYRFIHETTIDTYKKFLSNYQELSHSEIMWVLSFVHRTFVKRECRSMYFSVDFMKLLQDMTSNTTGLPHSSPARKEVENFLAYYMSKLVKSLDRTPSLFVELLFNKLPESTYYFDHGYDQVKPTKASRGATIWVFRDAYGLTQERKAAIVIAALLDEEKGDVIDWVTARIAEINRRRTEYPEGVIPPDEPIAVDESQKKVVLRDGKLRLLFSTFLFDVGVNSVCIVPGNLSSENIENAEKWLKRYMFETVVFEDGAVAADYLRRKRSNEDVSSEDEEPQQTELDNRFLVSDGEEPNGFNDARFHVLPEDELRAKKLAALTDRARRENNSSKGIGGSKAKKLRVTNAKETNVENGREKEARETERMRKIKSSAFVHDSDDATDEERDEAFFDSERKLRVMLQRARDYGDVLIRESNNGSETGSIGYLATEPDGPGSPHSPQSEALFVSDVDTTQPSRVRIRPGIIADDDE